MSDNDYFTLGFRQKDGTIKKYHIPVRKIKCIINTKNGTYYHLTTGFVGPFKNEEWIKGGLDSFKPYDIKIPINYILYKLFIYVFNSSNDENFLSVKSFTNCL